MYKKLQLAILLVVLILALTLNGCTTPPDPVIEQPTPTEAPTEVPETEPTCTPAPDDAGTDELLIPDDTENWDTLMPGIPAPNQGAFSGATSATSGDAIIAQRVFLENVSEDTWNAWLDAMPTKGWTASDDSGIFNESLQDSLSNTFDLSADNETWLGKETCDIVYFESCDGGLVQAMYNPETKNMIVTKL